MQLTAMGHRVARLTRYYQTCQHLRNLPEHLYQDIGKTEPCIHAELNKYSLKRVFFNSLRHLIKGF